MTQRRSAGQIPLALGLQDKPGFELFVVGNNAEVLHGIKSIARGIKHSGLYIWGQPGSGVSHLLQAACMLAHDQGRAVAYVPLLEQANLDPDLLDNMDSMDMVCIDDIDLIAGQPHWELAILHLYNALRENRHSLLIGAHTSPQALPMQLPDLKSRMNWDLVYHLQALDDADKIEVLQRRADARAFELPREVAEYIVNRSRRGLPDLLSILDRLEQATLAEQRKLTIPFVKTCLMNSDK
jgi:DnaA-homolog protein